MPSFVTSADFGEFEEEAGRMWANTYYFDDYREDSSDHIGYKPCKSPCTVEVAKTMIEHGIGIYDLVHKPRPNKLGRAVSTVVKATFLKELDLHKQADFSKINDELDPLYIVSFDVVSFNRNKYRKAWGLQAYREDSEKSMGYKPMEFEVYERLQEDLLTKGVGFYAAGYDAKPTKKADGTIESLLLLSKAELVKSFDVFGWYNGLQKKKPVPVVTANVAEIADEKKAA